jgi:hypothetical protein
MIATAKPMVNPERAAEWDWVLIPRIRKAPAMCPTNRTNVSSSEELGCACESMIPKSQQLFGIKLCEVSKRSATAGMRVEKRIAYPGELAA